MLFPSFPFSVTNNLKPFSQLLLSASSSPSLPFHPLSCSTIRRSEQLPFDPGKMAMMVRTGSTTHSSNCTRLWCSKKPHSTRNVLLGKLTCVAQTPQGDCGGAEPKQLPLDLLPSLSQQNLSISVNVSRAVCWAPPFLPSVASQSTRYFSCHFATSGAFKASHHRIIFGMSAIGLSLVIFFGIKKTSSCMLVAAIFHSALPSPRTAKCLLSFLLSHLEEPWGGSRHTPLLSLLCTISTLFFQFTPFQPWQRLLQFSQFLIFQCFSSTFCTSSPHCQCFAHSFIFASHCQCCGLGDLVQKFPHCLPRS